MKLYLTIDNDREILSDGFKIEFLYDGVVAKVKSTLVVKADGEVDIGCGNAFGGSGEQEQGGNPVQKVIDVADNFQLQSFGVDWAGFASIYKGYCKKVLDRLNATKPDRVDAFKAGAKQFMNFVKSNIEDGEFWYKEYDTEDAIIFSIYPEGAEAPQFYYLVEGLKEMKV